MLPGAHTRSSDLPSDEWKEMYLDVLVDVFGCFGMLWRDVLVDVLPVRRHVNT